MQYLFIHRPQALGTSDGATNTSGTIAHIHPYPSRKSSSGLLCMGRIGLLPYFLNCSTFPHMSSQPPPNNPGPLPGGSVDAAPKVAIPRLQTRSVSGRASSSKEERRVPVACTACRSHKIRCSGDYPRCKNCENADRECVYVHHRRDRLKMSV